MGEDLQQATVTLHPHGELTTHFGRAQGGVPTRIRPGMTIRELLRDLGVPEGEVWVCARNGAVVSPDEPLARGDTVELFSPVAGGR
jgi:sulfur carrier protein ThiS